MGKRTPLAVAIAAVSLGPLASTAVLAGGYALNEQGAHASGTANAGAAASVENASILYFNPAGMTRLPGTQISFGAAILDVKPDARIERATNALGMPVAGGDGGDFVDLAVVPNIYMTHNSGNVAVGLGIYVPFGLEADYDNDFRGRFLADKTEIQVISFQPTFAFNVTDQLSLGLGLNIMYGEGRLSRYQDYTGAIALAAQRGEIPPEAVPLIAGQLREGYFDIEGHDWELGWTLGLLYSPREGTHLGITYRSEAKFNFKGEVVLSEFPQVLSAAPLTLGFQTFQENGEVPLDTPESVTLSLRQDFAPRWTLLAGATWTRWSRFQNLDVFSREGPMAPIAMIGSVKYGAPGTDLIGHVPEHWSNTWSFALGGLFHLNDQWTLKAGYAFDDSPIHSRYRTARVPSSDRHWLTLGAQWRQGERGWVVDAAFGYLIIHDVEVNEVEYQVNGNPVAGGTNYRATYEIDAWGAGLQFSRAF